MDMIPHTSPIRPTLAGELPNMSTNSMYNMPYIFIVPPRMKFHSVTAEETDKASLFITYIIFIQCSTSCKR